MNKTSAHKSRTLALILAVIFFGLGFHNFYLGRIGIGVTQLILTAVGTMTTFLLIGFIPLFIVGVWIIIDICGIILSPSTPDFTW